MHPGAEAEACTSSRVRPQPTGSVLKKQAIARTTLQQCPREWCPNIVCVVAESTTERKSQRARRGSGGRSTKAERGAEVWRCVQKLQVKNIEESASRPGRDAAAEMVRLHVGHRHRCPRCPHPNNNLALTTRKPVKSVRGALPRPLVMFTRACRQPFPRRRSMRYAGCRLVKRARSGTAAQTAAALTPCCCWCAGCLAAVPGGASCRGGGAGTRARWRLSPAEQQSSRGAPKSVSACALGVHLPPGGRSRTTLG